ncbi:response regulator [Alcanivorax sp. VBW004]|uniref:Response regulator receiver protein n=1 Tax=Alcanivorax jadensis T9 TaxID=1177181 RepID=A0ABR4WGW6_9GAMM|nr:MULTISPECIES: response regulator [Alcanivorax]KGD62384.1 response regulator receiver protein [Alcanivorax jadensis T9]MTT51575.1 response regulator [Alcanivorax sp. VBW004]
MGVKDFAESAQGFTKSPLGIIALFIVLVYGFASIVVGFGNSLGDNSRPLIWFLFIFPFVVFFGFLWLVAKHHSKLYGPSDFANEENFLKANLASAVSLAAATAKYATNDESGTINAESDLESIVNKLISKPPKTLHKSKKKKILWVDDKPDNNIYERNAFEAQGIEITLATSTEEALDLVNKYRNQYGVIISDMNRKEGSSEGYVLLDKLRESKNNTPFVIYAGANSQRYKQQAKDRGALEATNNASELFSAVMSALNA